MLAGALHPPPLRQQLGMPVVCLPLGVCGKLLTAWTDALGEALDAPIVQIAVNSEEDAQTLRTTIDEQGVNGSARVVAEPASWRGTGGLIRDLCRDDPDRGIMVVEAHCLPPASLDGLLQALDDSTHGVVATTDDEEPAGLYVFDQTALKPIPAIGYFDLKEQLLPALNRRGCQIRAVRITDRVFRIRDRASYLQAIRAIAERHGEGSGLWRSPEADIAPSARIAGHCIVEQQVVVKEGAVVHDSVLLSGAIVEEKAVVSRSVVAPGVRVAAGSKVVDRVAGDRGSAALAGLVGGGSPPPAHLDPRTTADATRSL
jgi:hypothetical protein